MHAPQVAAHEADGRAGLTVVLHQHVRLRMPSRASSDNMRGYPNSSDQREQQKNYPWSVHLACNRCGAADGQPVGGIASWHQWIVCWRRHVALQLAAQPPSLQRMGSAIAASQYVSHYPTSPGGALERQAVPEQHRMRWRSIEPSTACSLLCNGCDGGTKQSAHRQRVAQQLVVRQHRLRR